MLHDIEILRDSNLNNLIRKQEEEGNVEEMQKRKNAMVQKAIDFRPDFLYIWIKKEMYKEVQRTVPWWVYLVTGGLGILALVFSFYMIKQSSSVEEIQRSVLASILIVLIPLVLIIILFSIKLETMITAEGVYFRFFPFQFKFKHIPWPEITAATVRKYRPYSEFGGWGIRFNFREKETAYCMNGNMGLEMVLKNGRKVLLGTQQPEEIGKAVMGYMEDRPFPQT
jgi:hypothetical protein